MNKYGLTFNNGVLMNTKAEIVECEDCKIIKGIKDKQITNLPKYTREQLKVAESVVPRDLSFPRIPRIEIVNMVLRTMAVPTESSEAESTSEGTPEVGFLFSMPLSETESIDSPPASVVAMIGSVGEQRRQIQAMYDRGLMTEQEFIASLQALEEDFEQNFAEREEPGAPLTGTRKRKPDTEQAESSERRKKRVSTLEPSPDEPSTSTSIVQQLVFSP